MPQKMHKLVHRYESIPEAAERVGVCTRTVRRWIATGQLAGYRMGPRLIRIDADALDEMLQRIPTGRSDD